MKLGENWIVGDSTGGKTVSESYPFSIYGAGEFTSGFYKGKIQYKSTASFNLAAKVNKGGAEDMFM